MIPDANNAPSMVGVTPPDRVQMTLEDHYNAILDFLRNALENDTMTPDDMMATRAFEEAKQQIFQTALGAQQGGDGEMADQPAMAQAGPEVPYGGGGEAPPPLAGGF